MGSGDCRRAIGPAGYALASPLRLGAPVWQLLDVRPVAAKFRAKFNGDLADSSRAKFRRNPKEALHNQIDGVIGPFHGAIVAVIAAADMLLLGPSLRAYEVFE